jgi:signal transduction histidine kinase
MRDSLISTARDASDGLLLAVRDTGLDPRTVDRLFDAFYTIKLNGMGMGLAVLPSSTATRATVG